jgi:hypothetical protein
MIYRPSVHADSKTAATMRARARGEVIVITLFIGQLTVHLADKRNCLGDAAYCQRGIENSRLLLRDPLLRSPLSLSLSSAMC